MQSVAKHRKYEAKPKVFNTFEVLHCNINESLCCVWHAQAKDAYFRAIADEIDNGGCEALMHYLLNYDVSGFVPACRPDACLQSMTDQKVLRLHRQPTWRHGVHM